jgi:acyl carrier protein
MSQGKLLGLDGVEILMATEEKFGITISEEAQNIQTVGELCELVTSKIKLTQSSLCLS